MSNKPPVPAARTERQNDNSTYSLLMAYLHCQIRIPTPIRTANQMATLYCVDYFHTARRPFQIPTLIDKYRIESGSVNVNKPLGERWRVGCPGLGTTPTFYIHSIVKVCSHVTKFSPSPIFAHYCLALCQWITGRIGDRPILPIIHWHNAKQ